MEGNEIAVINIESIEDSIFLVVSVPIIDDDEPIPLSLETINTKGKAFPNPAKDNIRIQLKEDARIDNIDFIDLDGKVIKAKYIRKQNKLIEINVSNLNNGVYILNITSDKVVNRIKVIIER